MKPEQRLKIPEIFVVVALLNELDDVLSTIHDAIICGILESADSLRLAECSTAQLGIITPVSFLSETNCSPARNELLCSRFEMYDRLSKSATLCRGEMMSRRYDVDGCVAVAVSFEPAVLIQEGPLQLNLSSPTRSD